MQVEIEYRATLDALKKAEKWRAQHPRNRIREKEEPRQSEDIQKEDVVPTPSLIFRYSVI